MRAPLPTPSGTPVRLGARLRASRRAQGMTIDGLAIATRLTKGFISRIENDSTSPSVATLVTICEVLSLPIGSLFEEPERQLVPLASAPLINMGGSGAVERLVTPRTEGRIQMLRSTLHPYSNGGGTLYTINCDVETLHVLRGRVRLRFTTSELVLRTGDTVTFSGKDPHTWSNDGTTTAEVVWTLVPAAWSGSSMSTPGAAHSFAVRKSRRADG